MNIVSKILCYCAGANFSVLKNAKSDIMKLESVGLTIIFTGIFAALSGGYAIHQIFNVGDDSNTRFILSIVLGIVWGLMIFNLDRYIVMSMVKSGNFKKELLTASPRIILAIIISIVVAKPLEVRIFQDRISAQIVTSKLNQLDSNINKIKGITDIETKEKSNQSKKDEIEQYNQRLIEDCPTQSCIDNKKSMVNARKKYDDNKAIVQPKINDADENIRFINNTDRYKITSIVDNKEITELTEEGKQKLRYYTKLKNESVNSRQSFYPAYLRAKSQYETAVNKYKESVRSKLVNAKEERDSLKSNLAVAVSLTTQLEKEATSANNTSYTNNFITQLEALGELSKWKEDKLSNEGEIIEKANNTMWYMNIAIVLLFIVIETAPVFVKIITNRSAYDIELQGNLSVMEADIIHRSNYEISKKSKNHELKTEALEHQIEVITSSINKWKSDRKKEILTSTMTDSEHKDYIKRVIDMNEFEIV